MYIGGGGRTATTTTRRAERLAAKREARAGALSVRAVLNDGIALFLRAHERHATRRLPKCRLSGNTLSARPGMSPAIRMRVARSRRRVPDRRHRPLSSAHRPPRCRAGPRRQRDTGPAPTDYGVPRRGEGEARVRLRPCTAERDTLATPEPLSLLGDKAAPPSPFLFFVSDTHFVYRWLHIIYHEAQRKTSGFKRSD